PSDPGLTTEEETPDAPSTFTVASTETPPKEGEGVAPAGVAAKGKEGGEKKKETRKVNPTLLGLGIGFVLGGAVMGAYLGVAAYREIDPTDFKKVFTKGIPAGSRTYVWHGRQIDAAMKDLDKALGKGEKPDIETKTQKLNRTIDALGEKVTAAGDLPEASARLRELRTIARIEDPEVRRTYLSNPDWDVVRAKTLVNLNEDLWKIGQDASSGNWKSQEDLKKLATEEGEYKRLLAEYYAVQKKLPGGELRRAADDLRMFYGGEVDAEAVETYRRTIDSKANELSLSRGAGPAAAASEEVKQSPLKRGFSRGVAGQQVAALDSPGWKRAAGPAVMIAMMLGGAAMIAAGSAGVGAQLAAGTGSCGDFASLALAHETQLKVDLDALFAAEEARP
ncbi:MAG: hypothetical protein HYW48_04540, partial [Deltaproteobacteria bacterium]|nr:hypothetical protein [Deltaproteobacteria bacterium]